MKILHFISGLERGGAENTLKSLAYGLGLAGFSNSVLSMTSKGPIGEDLVNAGVEVRALGMRRGLPSPAAIQTFRSLLEELRPDLVQSWLYHADLLSSLALRGVPWPKLVWNVRGTVRPLRTQGVRTSLVVRANVWFSGRPDAIVFNSNQGMKDHVRLGYQLHKAAVIPNGVDTKRFKPKTSARELWRKRLGIHSDDFVIGHVGRFHNMKNQKSVVQAFGRFSREYPQARLVMVGRGIDSENRELTDWIVRHASTDVVHLLGDRHDIADVYSMMDALVLASLNGEGFPNALAEAMASEVLCIAPDVGDALDILGENGIRLGSVYEHDLLHGFSAAAKYPHSERDALVRRARQSIIDRYSVARMVEQYSSLYMSLSEDEPQ